MPLSLFDDGHTTTAPRPRRKRRKGKGGGGPRPHRYAVEQTEFFNKDNRPPSPEEIAAACLAYQGGWSPEEMAERAGRPFGERKMYRVSGATNL